MPFIHFVWLKHLIHKLDLPSGRSGELCSYPCCANGVPRSWLASMCVLLLLGNDRWSHPWRRHDNIWRMLIRHMDWYVILATTEGGRPTMITCARSWGQTKPSQCQIFCMSFQCTHTLSTQNHFWRLLRYPGWNTRQRAILEIWSLDNQLLEAPALWAAHPKTAGFSTGFLLKS